MSARRNKKIAPRTRKRPPSPKSLAVTAPAQPAKLPVQGSSQNLAANQLEVVTDGRPIPELLAESMLSPISLNALVAMNFVRPHQEKNQIDAVGINAFAKVMQAKADAVAKGDLSGVEATLASQIVTMDAAFASLMIRAQANLGQYPQAAETYMRLALRAQAQCRAAVETLAEMKNPRPIFINPRQVNAAYGPQQVNNGLSGDPEPTAPRAENGMPANKLLES